MSDEKTGGCLCGAIRYRVTGALRPVVACHCTQCRKTSGHYVAATQCASNALHVSGETLTWFRSSASAERGFCHRCGSNLFWRRIPSEYVSIWAGSLDGDTGLQIEGQIHTDSKGDYYVLPDVPVIRQQDLK